METSDFLLSNMRLCHKKSGEVEVGALLGWDRATKKLWPTLARQSEDEAWGFSLSLGTDVGDNTAHWSGVAAKRSDRGIWAKVGQVFSVVDAAAAAKGSFSRGCK